MALVEVDGVSKSYPRHVGLRTEQHAVVQDVSLAIESGETLGLVGESGSGKTTLARMILGLAAPTLGVIRLDGIDVARASRAELRRLRRQMQPVFQDPYAALNPRMKVQEIVTEPWAIHGRELPPEINGPAASQTLRDPVILSEAQRSRRTSFWGIGERVGSHRLARLRAVDLLAEVGLDESALSRYPHEFSGGQRQRINIARALALRPKLLILDEPVSALDVSVGAQIVNLLRRLQSEHGLTYLFISHSMPLVRYLSTRIAVMERGRLVETGEAVALCANPQQAYTRQLIQATPELPASVA
jgi:ABC-type glutathione transport system ATPase component